MVTSYQESATADIEGLSHVEPAQPGARPRFGPSNLAIIVAVLFGLSLLIRVADLGGKSLWIDEGASVFNAQEDMSIILESRQDDKHPPGYYALLHYVANVDDSEAAVRLPSAIASALTVVLIYLLGRRLVGHTVGLLAAALGMFSPIDIWYAQEARQPTLATLLVFVAAYGLLRHDWTGRILAFVGLTVGLYLDYLTAAGWVVVGAVWTYMWWKRDRVRVLEYLAISAGGFTIFAILQGSHFWNGFTVLQEDVGVGIWYGAILGSNPLTSNPVGILITIFLLALLGSHVTWRLLNSTKLSRLFSVVGIGLFGLMVAVMPAPRAFSIKKILIAGWPILLLFVAYVVLTRLAVRWRTPTLVALLLVSVASSAITLFAVPKDDWRSAVAYVNANAATGDAAWIAPDAWAPGVYLYYEGELPVLGAADPGEVLDTSSGIGDVWVITKRRPQDPIPALAAEAWFDENWEFIDEVPFYRLAVRHYTQP